MLYLLDIFLTFLHLAIVVFNLFGWIPVYTRKAHLFIILLTAGSWFILGIWKGIGYCPITEWQWNIKEELGEKNLPGSFIKYFADRALGKDFDPHFINTITIICFAAATITSLYVNFFMKKGKKTAKP